MYSIHWIPKKHVAMLTLELSPVIIIMPPHEYFFRSTPALTRHLYSTQPTNKEHHRELYTVANISIYCTNITNKTFYKGISSIIKILALQFQLTLWMWNILRYANKHKRSNEHLSLYIINVSGQDKCGCVGFSKVLLFLFFPGRTGLKILLSSLGLLKMSGHKLGPGAQGSGLKCEAHSLHTMDGLPLNHLIAVPLMGFMNLRSQKCSLRRRNTIQVVDGGERRKPKQCWLHFVPSPHRFLWQIMFLPQSHQRRGENPISGGRGENSNSFYVSFSLSCSFSFPPLIEEHKNKNHFSLCRRGWDSML